MSDRPMPAHRGDVTGEYVALRRAAGLVNGMRATLWVTGPDAVSFLDGILSQDLAGMAPGAVSRSLLLEPRGKLRAVMWVLRGEDRLGLICDAGRRDTVVEDLNRYRFRVRAEIEASEVPVLEVWGPGSGEVLRAAGLPVPDGWAAGGGAAVAAIPLGRLERWAVIGGSQEELADAGARPVGRLAVDAVRIEGGEAVVGVDVDETTIPQEAGLVAATVSFTKGCYLGQELVARIDSRGRVNRHLRGVVMTENIIPPVGATVRVATETVGALTSVAESLTVRAPVALAMLRREVEPGADVEVAWDGGSVGAVAQELPLDDFADALHASNGGT